MNLKFLGTEYGGWSVDLDSIKSGDCIIDAGLGEDISLLQELSKYYEINIIGIDPTEKSHKYVESLNLSNLKLYKKAIAKNGISNIEFFKNSNPNYVSESYFNEHSSVSLESYKTDCVSFKELIEKYNPSFIKMDIEGAEYDVLEECIGVNQICVEFHHHCVSSKNFNDTINSVKMMMSNGYKLISSRNDIEFTFLKNN
jgi:FkbM family methyltransferase